MYAIIKIAGKQYRVSEGQTLEINKIDNKVGETLKIEPVLLLADEEDVSIGQPNVPGAVVEAKVLEQLKGEKIRVARYKSKVRYRKVKGFRALLTKIQIGKIGNPQSKKTQI